MRRRSNCLDRAATEKKKTKRESGRKRRNVKGSTERKGNDKTECERTGPGVGGGYRPHSGLENRAEIEL